MYVIRKGMSVSNGGARMSACMFALLFCGCFISFLSIKICMQYVTHAYTHNSCSSGGLQFVADTHGSCSEEDREKAGKKGTSSQKAKFVKKLIQKVESTQTRERAGGRRDHEHGRTNQDLGVLGDCYRLPHHFHKFLHT